MRTLVLTISVLALASAPVALAADPDERARANARVVEAIHGVLEIPEQAAVVAALAWPENPGDVPPLVREEARAFLIPYRSRAVEAIRAVIRRGDAWGGDATAALIEIRIAMESGLPHDYFGVLDDALWFGSRDARRVAMAELAVFRDVLNPLAIMDAAEEDPELLPIAISTLGAVRSDRARFWLAGHLNGADPDLRDASAMALASIGGRALEPLREAVVGGGAELRAVAVRALVPVAGPEDLTALYEYLAGHPDDPPDLVAAVRERALAIEALADEWHESQSATPR